MSGLRDELAALADEKDLLDSEDRATWPNELRALLDRFPPEAEGEAGGQCGECTPAAPSTASVLPADQCGDVHEFNPVVECSCTEPRGHGGPHRSDWIDGAIGKPYTWGAAPSTDTGEGLVPLSCGICGESVPNPVDDVHVCQRDIRSRTPLAARPDTGEGDRG